MLRWIAFAGGAALLSGAAWYFGRPELLVVPSSVPISSPARETAKPDAPRDLPPLQVIEVIDLSRAYEPAPEPSESSQQTIDPASYVEFGKAPARMPYAARTSGGLVGCIDRTIRIFELRSGLSQLLKESPELRKAREEFHRFWMNNQPSVLTYERLNGAIGP